MEDTLIILASESPRRHELLAKIRDDYRVIPCSLSEPRPPERASPAAWAESMALFKARAVAESNPGRWVLGADTVVACEGRLLGKPANVGDARRMLSLQAGRVSDVITGIALVRIDCTRIRVIARETTRVWMRDDPRFIESYLAAGLWRGKAGAYGIQDTGDALIERIEGSFDNVVGLPTDLLKKLFTRLGI